MNGLAFRTTRRKIRTLTAVPMAMTLIVFGGTALLDVVPASASGISITFTGKPPASVIAGSSLSLAVSVQNDDETVTSGAGSTDTITIGSSCLLSQSSSLTETAKAGVAIFSSVTLDTGPSCTLTAIDTTTPDHGLIAVSPSIAVFPGTPSHLAFTMWPSPVEVAAGTAFSPFSVAVDDVYNNIETVGSGSSDVIVITSPCALSGTTSSIADSGVATFDDVVPTVSGACPLTATDETRSIASASNAITSPPISPAPLKVTRVSGAIAIGKATVLDLVGSGFFGRPRVLVNVAGVKAVVTRDTGTRLTVVVFAKPTVHRGLYVFTIILPNGKRTAIHIKVT